MLYKGNEDQRGLIELGRSEDDHEIREYLRRKETEGPADMLPRTLAIFWTLVSLLVK